MVSFMFSPFAGRRFIDVVGFRQTFPCLPRNFKNSKRRIEEMLRRTIFLVLFAASALFGQTSATLRGLITDQSGAVLPGVSISVRNQQTGVERTTLSDETGNYQVAALPVGVYQIGVRLPGMRPQIVSALTLEVGQIVVRDFKMEVGGIA